MSVLIFSSKNVPLTEGIRKSNSLLILNEFGFAESKHAVKDVKGKWIDSQHAQQERQKVYSIYLQAARKKQDLADVKSNKQIVTPPCFDKMSLPQISHYIHTFIDSKEEAKPKKETLGDKAKHLAATVALAATLAPHKIVSGEYEGEGEEGNKKEEEEPEPSPDLTPEQLVEHHKLVGKSHKFGYDKVKKEFGSLKKLLKNVVRAQLSDAISTSIESSRSLQSVEQGGGHAEGGAANLPSAEGGSEGGGEALASSSVESSAHVGVEASTDFVHSTEDSFREEDGKLKSHTTKNYLHALHPLAPLERHTRELCSVVKERGLSKTAQNLMVGGATALVGALLFAHGCSEATVLIDYAKEMIPHLHALPPMVAHAATGGLEHVAKFTDHLKEASGEVGKNFLSPEHWAESPKRSARLLIQRFTEIAKAKDFKEVVKTSTVGAIKGTVKNFVAGSSSSFDGFG